MRTESVSKINYSDWIDRYIVENKINITSKLIYGVIQGKFYDITIMQFLNCSKNIEPWQDVIKRKLTIFADIGRDPVPFLKIFCENAIKMGYTI